MDRPRVSYARKLRRRRILIGVAASAAVVAAGVGLARLEPAAPTVQRSVVFLDTVKRGQLVRQVRGVGTLAPETIVYVPAPEEGRIDRKLVEPGQRVDADTVLVVLSNPTLEQELLDAEAQLKAAQADLANLQAQLESQRLDQASIAAQLEGEYLQAKAQYDADLEQAKYGLISQVELTKSRVTMEQARTRLQLERDRDKIRAPSVEAQLQAQRARIDQLETLAALRRRKLANLRVRAGVSGVLQQMDVEVGQQVSPGAELARISDPERLKAQLKIPETLISEIRVGQRAEIDTRNGVVEGRVARIDPAAVDGTVLVDVELLGELPAGARPDLSVDGRIEIERLDDVLYVGRPVYAQSDSTLSLFRLEPDGVHASRTAVRVGKISVNAIEIRDGLEQGDQVILSDMSMWEAYDRIRLE